MFTWRRLVAQGALAAAGSGEEVVPASDYRALQGQVRELHRLLGKKTLEAEILKEALEHATGSKKLLRLPPWLPPKRTRRSVDGACLRTTRQPVHRRHDLITGFDMERGNLTRGDKGNRRVANTTSENTNTRGRGATTNARAPGG